MRGAAGPPWRSRSLSRVPSVASCRRRAFSRASATTTLLDHDSTAIRGCASTTISKSADTTRAALSDPNPFDLIEREAVQPPVVELRRARARMVRHRRRRLEVAAAFEVGGDPGGTQAVIADPGRDAGTLGAAANHRVSLGLAHRLLAQRARVASDAREQEPFRRSTEAGALEVLGEIALQVVVAGHLVILAVLLVQPHPEAALLRVDVLDAHGERGADAREAVGHERDQRAVAKARVRRDVDGIEEVARLSG